MANEKTAIKHLADTTYLGARAKCGVAGGTLAKGSASVTCKRCRSLLGLAPLVVTSDEERAANRFRRASRRWFKS